MKNKEELELLEGEEELVLEEEAIDERPGRAREKADKRPKKEKRPPGKLGKKIREVFSELRKVTWPKFKEVVKKTGVVLVVVLAFMVVIFGVDLLLAEGLKALNPPSS